MGGEETNERGRRVETTGESEAEKEEANEREERIGESKAGEEERNEKGRGTERTGESKAGEEEANEKGGGMDMSWFGEAWGIPPCLLITVGKTAFRFTAGFPEVSG